MRSGVFVALFWLGVLLLVLVSLIPNVSLPGMTVDAGVKFRISREILAHFLGCVLLGWLYVKAYGLSAKGVIFLVLVAASSEVIQYLFTAGRNIEIKDLTYNVLGVGLGMMLERLARYMTSVVSGRGS